MSISVKIASIIAKTIKKLIPFIIDTIAYKINPTKRIKVHNKERSPVDFVFIAFIIWGISAIAIKNPPIYPKISKIIWVRRELNPQPPLWRRLFYH